MASVTEDQVHAVCNELAASGAPVTVRAVYSASGGSRSNVAAWVKSWKQAHGHTSMDLLPEDLREGLEQLLDADSLQARHTHLEHQVDAAEARLEALTRTVAEAERQLDALIRQCQEANARLQGSQERLQATRETFLAHVLGEDDAEDQ
jgi:septal ring factor EnvC (AmiA/AmiB activator)